MPFFFFGDFLGGHLFCISLRDFGNMLATPGNVRGLFVGADDDIARNGRCYDTALMSGADDDVAGKRRPFFLHHAKLPGCPGVSGAAEFQTQTKFVMSYRTLHVFWSHLVGWSARLAREAGGAAPRAH